MKARPPRPRLRIFRREMATRTGLISYPWASAPFDGKGDHHPAVARAEVRRLFPGADVGQLGHLAGLLGAARIVDRAAAEREEHEKDEVHADGDHKESHKRCHTGASYQRLVLRIAVERRSRAHLTPPGPAIIFSHYLAGRNSMPSVTSQHLAHLYDTYAGDEVTFNSQVILASGLLPSDIHLKIADTHVPCVLYACSMKSARVIAELTDDKRGAAVPHGQPPLSSARIPAEERARPGDVLRLLPGRDALGVQSAEAAHVSSCTLEFTQRPSDALIEILGSLLEINSNSVRRRDERIVITPESMKKIGLESKESCVAIEGAPRRCIVRDLSFGGAKILVTGMAEPRPEKKVLLKLNRCEMKDDTVLDGSIVRVEDVEGRTDVVALSIQFTSEPPISYKQKINGYFSAPGDAD